MTDKLNPLLDAVDALTKPRIEHFAQKDDAGMWLKAHTINHPPLLEQLAIAVTSSIGSGGRRTGSDPWSTSPLDSDALYQAGKIQAAIGSWCRIVNVTPTRDMCTDLIRWYIAYTRNDNEPQWYVRQLWSWVRMIESKLDQPRRVELKDACPVCGQNEYEDAAGCVLKFPVVVEYHDYGTAEPIKPRALCRACLVVWEGVGAIEELGDELKGEATDSEVAG